MLLLWVVQYLGLCCFGTFHSDPSRYSLQGSHPLKHRQCSWCQRHILGPFIQGKISCGLHNPRLVSHSYDNSVYKKLICGLRRPRTSISCLLYEQFAAYISRRLCSPWLIFPRMNGPIASVMVCHFPSPNFICSPVVLTQHSTTNVNHYHTLAALTSFGGELGLNGFRFSGGFLDSLMGGKAVRVE